jgi:hypothetical protein
LKAPLSCGWIDPATEGVLVPIGQLLPRSPDHSPRRFRHPIQARLNRRDWVGAFVFDEDAAFELAVFQEGDDAVDVERGVAGGDILPLVVAF